MCWYWLCACCPLKLRSSPSKSAYPPEVGCLQRAQKMTKTTSGKTINQTIQGEFDTRDQLNIRKQTEPLCMRYVFDMPLNDFTQITNNLFLTSFGGISAENIRQYDIKCIISATHETPVFKVVGIENIRVPVEDSPNENLYKYFEEIVAKIDTMMTNNKKTVIHCWAGKCRSTSITVAYLMKGHKMPLTEAYQLVRNKRPFIHINKGFLKQLYIYEKDLFGKNFENYDKIKAMNSKSLIPPEVLTAIQPNAPELPTTPTTDKPN